MDDFSIQLERKVKERWLRRQMDPRMRAVFATVFTLFAIKTLVLAVRGKAAERHAAVERLMRHELFDDGLRTALVAAPDPGTAVAAVADALAPRSGDARGLAAAYAEGGVKAFETRLMRDFLAEVAAARLHPAIRRFFDAFVDLRNVMTLYKHLRWGMHDPAAFVPGGTLSVARLAEASAHGDATCLDECVGEFLGGAATVGALGEAVDCSFPTLLVPPHENLEQTLPQARPSLFACSSRRASTRERGTGTPHIRQVEGGWHSLRGRVSTEEAPALGTFPISCVAPVCCGRSALAKRN